SNWTTYLTPRWYFGYSENRYNNSKISLEWLTRVFNPQTKGVANGRPRILISNGFRTYETLEILEFSFANNIILCRLPSHTSYKLQPCNIGVFAPLKAAYRDEVKRLYRGGLETVGKEHFTSLYKPAREKAITKRNITAGWAASGLFPFNPDRVLRHTPKPPAESAFLTETESCPQVEVLDTPVTPTTPVTIEAVTSLYNLIKDKAYTLHDKQSKQRLQQHVRKLASAAQISFAKQTLLQD
ncbi:DDE-domain-containing protein, partial [Lophiostoma macrostomum CBS 122681]